MLARDNGHVEVNDLAAELATARETIRRDLHALDQQGLVRRVHGGAIPVETADYETSLAERANVQVAEKRRIAREAITRLNGAETIFLDEGHSMQLIAEGLPDDRRLTVVTASVPAAMALGHRQNITVFVLGGRLRGHTMGTVDHWALRTLTGMTIDLAYLGTNGISTEHGLTTPDPAVGAVKAQAIRVARRVILSSVHTKFGVATFHKFGDVKDLTTIITDTSLPAPEARRYHALGPEVIRV